MNKILFSTLAASVLAMAGIASAHHGTSVSYDMVNPWTTDAVVVEFTYANPHPRLVFDRTSDKGEKEHWDSELISNPSMMMRAGWNRTKSTDALKPGTKVKLTLSTSKANPRSAVVRAIQNEAGEYIVMAANNAVAPVPGQGQSPEGANRQ